MIKILSLLHRWYIKIRNLHIYDRLVTPPIKNVPPLVNGIGTIIALLLVSLSLLTISTSIIYACRYSAGIGIAFRMDAKEEVLSITAITINGPAEKAGLHLNDTIVLIDSKTIPKSYRQLILKLRGPKGSPVNLTIKRDSLIFPKTVIRDYVGIKNNSQFEKTIN